MRQRVLKSIWFLIALRVVLPVLLTIVLFVSANFFLVIPTLREHMMTSKREMLQELTTVAVDLLADYEKRVQEGELFREEAQNRAKERLRIMRYGPEKKNYFWINDMRPVIVMHPFLQQLEGLSLADYDDPRPGILIKIFAETVRNNGSGYVDYFWQRGDDPSRIVPKLSYVQGFKPWGWVVGTGVYIEDVQVAIAEINRKINRAFMGIVFLLLVISGYLVCQGAWGEKKRSAAEKALWISEERYRIVAEKTGQMVYDYNTATGKLLWQGAIEGITGYSPEEFQEVDIDGWADLLHPDDRELMLNLMDKAQRECGKFDVEYKLRRKDGSYVHIAEHGIFLPDEEGLAYRMLGSMGDISARKQAEQARLEYLSFLESLETVEHAMRASDDLDEMLQKVIDVTFAIFGCDRAWLLYPCDPDASDFSIPVERTAPEFMGGKKGNLDLMMSPSEREIIRTILESRELVTFGVGGDYPLDPKHKEKFNVLSQAVMAIRPKVGKPWAFGMHQCSYDRVWTEPEKRLITEIGRRIGDALSSLLFLRDLKVSEERYRTMIDTAGEGVWIIGLDSKTTFVNQQMASMLGYTAEEMMGRCVPEFLSDAEEIETFWKKVENRKSGLGEQYELRFRRKEGVDLWAIVNANPMLDEANNVTSSFAMITDITERKRAEDALEKRIVALTQPLDDTGSLDFEDVFNLDDIQRLQDEFAEATGVASIITHTDGSPITRPSNFCRLCNDIIRKTEKGCANCFNSDAAMGRYNPTGPIIEQCKSGGLWDAGAAITVGGKHIANWLVGQVRDETQTEENMREYAKEIEADENAVVEAFYEVQGMSQEQFEKIAQAVFTLANQLSTTAYQNVQQARFITERQKAEQETLARQRFLDRVIDQSPFPIWISDANGTIQRTNAALRKILNLTDKQLVGKYNILQDPIFEKLGLLERFRSVYEQGKTVEFACVWDGNDIPGLDLKGANKVDIEGILFPIVNNKGQITHAMMTYEDVSERNRVQEELRASERNYREIFNAGNEAIFIHDAYTGEILDVNQTMCDMFGYTREEALQAEVADVSLGEYPYSQEEALIKIKKAREEGPQLFEWLGRRKNGELFWIEANLKKVVIGGQERILAVSRDITERKKAQESIISERDRANSYLELANTMFLAIGRDKKVTLINRKGCEVLGYSEEKVIGKNWFENFLPQCIKDEASKFFDKLMSGTLDPFEYFENPVLTKNGEERIIGWHDSLLKDADGTIIGVLFCGEDITDRKQSELKFHTLYELSGDAIMMLDEKGFFDCNEATVKMFGCKDKEEFCTKHPGDISPATQPNGCDSMDYAKKNIAVAMKEGIYRFEHLHRRLDGTEFPAEVLLNAMELGGKVVLQAIVHDITERKQAENEIRRLKNYLKNIVDSMPSILIGVDPQGNVTQWNHEAERVTGVNDNKAYGHKLEEVFPHMAGEMEKISQAIKQRCPIKDMKIPYKQNDETRFSDVTIYPLVANGVEGAVIRIDDVTERVRIEEMMIQSEKMLSVGGLAAGMAHEINNPLAGILQNTQVLKNRFSPELKKNRDLAEECGTTIEQIFDYIDKRGLVKMFEAINESGQRAAKIVENMLSFSRKSDTRRSSHDVAALLDRTVELAANDYDLKKKFDFRHIEIVREYAPAVPLVPCEASKIQQVFFNLLKNGAEAMAGSQNESPQPSRFTLRVLQDNAWVRIEIEDKGPGMDEKTRKRAFEPFFTTKGVDVGTGLGLSVSYFIITENHGGTMEVESSPGNGAKFVIRLPLNRSL